MKILLVNPPFYRFVGLEQDYVPLSLLAVGSFLTSKGHDVLVKNLEVFSNAEYKGYSDRSNDYHKYMEGVNDLNHPTWNDLRECISNYSPDKVGVTVMGVKFSSAMQVAAIAGDIPVFVGGPHPTVEGHVYPSNIEICKGEYESNGGRIQDLDLLPMPNFDILADQYSPNGYAHILSSRGCPFSCRFCASNTMWNRRVTMKSANRIIAEMRAIHSRFGCTSFTFWDEVFTANKTRLMEFCSKYNIAANWRCDTRADLIADDMVIAMKNAGCNQMSIGVESGSNRILQYIGKRETTDTLHRAASILNKHNIQWKAYCIIGFPEETEQDIFDTISFAMSLKPFRITVSIFTPYKGTPLFEECYANGMIPSQYDLAMYSHQSPHNHFTKMISHDRFIAIRQQVENMVDTYNQEALKVWR